MKDHEFPGVALSRSIGDKCASSLGVICDPEILEFDIKINIKYIVIGSDGIWEYMSNRRIMELVYSFYLNRDIDGACDKIVNEATTLWEIVFDY